MRLIDADKLKRHYAAANIYNDKLRDVCVDVINVINNIPTVEYCDEAVSRRVVNNRIEILDSMYGSDFYWTTRKLIDDTPSVRLTRSIGRWITVDETHSKCELCGSIFEIISENGEANFCPNCGARLSNDTDVE